jgi:hypothetical protein
VDAARPVLRLVFHTTLTAALTVGLLVVVAGEVCVSSGSMMTHLQINAAAQRMLAFAALHDGRMPATLDELSAALPVPDRLTDAWGRPLLVLTTPDAVALVSLGRDGALGGDGEDGDLLQVVSGRPGVEAAALLGSPSS